ncbi:DUF3050 domain-containing protein [Flavitalea flava]
MNKHVALLKEKIGPVRTRLMEHPVYHSIRGSEELRRFMQVHVYAVWDFMSLLKTLQKALTAVSIPWTPKGKGNTRYLINEIVLGEESDVDEEGRRTSHFELYLRAMEQAGASTGPVKALIGAIEEGQPVREAISMNVTDQEICDFLRFTFDVIDSGKLHAVASVFTFGREDLIPDMFLQFVNDFSKAAPGELTIFKYYMERHIEVDGGHHSILATAMLEDLCGDDVQKWEEAASFAIAALECRIGLWNAVMRSIG